MIERGYNDGFLREARGRNGVNNVNNFTNPANFYSQQPKTLEQRLAELIEPEEYYIAKYGLDKLSLIALQEVDKLSHSFCGDYEYAELNAPEGYIPLFN